MKKRFLILGLTILISGILPAQPDSCLIAYYPFSSNAMDESGNNHHGFVNGAYLTNDRHNNPNSAYLFDGLFSYIELNNNEPIILSTTFTITAWARIDGPGGGLSNGNQLFVQRNNMPVNTSAIGLKAENENGNMELAVRTSGNLVEYIEYPAPPYGNWNHFAGVCNDTSLLLYLNGILVASMDFSQAGGDVTDVDIVDIGRQYYSSLTYGLFNGAIDEVRIYDCALNSSEIFNLITAIKPANEQVHNFSVFPNPTTDNISINGLEAQTLQLELFNYLGQEIPVCIYHNIIDLSTLERGIYYLVIIGDDKMTLHTEKIIKE
nr:T9SS type A sorting domain-containing protein [Bacteroidota bacterium]